MMKLGIIPSDVLSENPRLEAKFFLDRYALNARKIERASVKKVILSQVAHVFNPPVFKRQFCSPTERAVPYCQSSDVTNMAEGSNIYINKAQAEKINALVDKNWILITGFGSIGNTRLTSILTAGSAYANNVCRIVPNGELPYGYLYAFLSSKYGIGQFNKNASGSVVRYIEAPGIKKTLIPILPDAEQQAIHTAIETAARLRVDANALLGEAIQTLEKRLPELRMPTSYIASSASFFGERLRLDATAHLTLIDGFFDKAGQNAALKTVESVSSQVFTPGIFKRMRVSDPSKGIPFLSGVNLLEVTPKFDDYLSRKMPNLADYVLREGGLASQDSGSITSMGYVSIVPKFLDGVTATNNLVRVVPGEINHNPYIYAFLKTAPGQAILRSFSYGTGQLHIDNGQISRLRIPIYEDLFASVTANVEAYSTKFSEAYQLETGAIARVEELVGSW